MKKIQKESADFFIKLDIKGICQNIKHDISSN